MLAPSPQLVPDVPLGVPFNLEAEQALLGALLFDNDALGLLPDNFRPEQFYEPFHSRLFAEIKARIGGGRRAEPISMLDRFKDDPAFAELGGIRYLADLVDRAPPAANAPEYALLIADGHMRREIIRLSTEILATPSSVPAPAVLAALERGAAAIAETGGSKPTAVHAGTTAIANMEAAWRGEFKGTKVGLFAIDDLSGGILQDDVWFAGGRTSMGKSVFGLNIAKGLALQGAGALVYSLEMPLRECQARLIADLAYERHGTAHLRYGDILKGDLEAARIHGHSAADAARYLETLPIEINDTGGLTIEAIRSQSQRQVRLWRKAGIKPGVIVIDHIGLVTPARPTDNKAADTAIIVNQLKDIAKQLKCPILALAQISRNTENRTDKRPQMGDFNWSGSIEQIADFVVLLYRESYYLERSSNKNDQAEAPALEHEVEFAVHKNRRGPIATRKAFIDIGSNVIRNFDTSGGAR